MTKQKFLTFLLRCLFTGVIFFCRSELSAQNATILYQGILKTASGAPVPDGNYPFTFTLWSSLNGTSSSDKLLIAGATDYNNPANQWSETVTLKVMGGIYSHQLGSVSPLNPRNFQSAVFLNVSVAGRNLVPRAGLVYSPYAFYVSNAYQAVCSGAVGDIKYSLLPPDKFKDVNGDCWVPLDGRTLASGDALAGYGVSSLPNAGGTFIRAQDFTGDANIERNWSGIIYGNSLFVAVANSGTGSRVMTSPDGINWTSRTSATDNNWTSVTYGNSLFVAVANSGTGNRVMTSPDGITWTSRSSAANNNWSSVTYGNGLFVAVSNSGTGNRVMTSTNGTTWTSRVSASNNNWTGITYLNGLFVAVANSGTGNRVMTSPDGTAWTGRSSAADNSWTSITNGNGLFVAVAGTGAGNRVMTSPDGITWTASRTPTEYWKPQNSTDADPGRTSSTAPGTLQTSDFKAHTHTTTGTDGGHNHSFQIRKRDATNGDNCGSDNSVESSPHAIIGTSTSSTNGDHIHTMNANSDGGNTAETRPVNLNLWVYIRIN